MISDFARLEMSSLGAIEIDGKATIGNLLALRNMKVPIYQRSYAWEEKHVLDFFGDLEGAIKATLTTSEYFLGSVVVTQKKGEAHLEVVDGQQRIATTMMVLAALRDYYHKANDQQRADQIDRPYLMDKDFDTGTPVPKLIMNEVDRDYFTNRVIFPPDSPERKAALEQKLTKNSHKLIHAAASKIADKLQEAVSKATTPQAKADILSAWFKFVKSGTRVILVTVEDEAKAYIMFETLNDRGLELSKADLLKNFLLSRSGHRVHEVLHRWLSMQTFLEASGKEEENLLVTYLRHFWSANHKLTRERDLYSSIKDDVKDSETKAFNLSDQLAENANPYAAILSASHTFWNEYGDAFKSIRTLNYFRLKQIRPLLLAVVTKMNNKQVEICLRLLVRCSVRFLIVGGLGGGQLEEKYTEAANQITSGKIKTGAKLLEVLYPAIPPNPEFHAAFAYAKVPQSQLARYYLRAMEMHLKGDPTPEWLPSDEKGINLEHILPENPDPEWHIKKDVVEANFEKLGNLALLKKKVNKKIANRFITFKNPSYAESTYKLTNELKGKSTWGLVDIEARQKKMAELAVKIWPLSL
jgi:hypothetical protein